MEGRIAFEIRGDQGFAYDSIFIPQDQDKTIGELGYPFKNQVSHRAIAVNKLIQQLSHSFLGIKN